MAFEPMPLLAYCVSIALIKQYGSHFTALIGWVHSNSLRFLRFMLLKICTKCGFYGHNEPKCRLPDGATSRFNVCLLVDSKQDGGSGNGYVYLPLGTHRSRYRAAFLFTCIGSCSLTGFSFQQTLNYIFGFLNNVLTPIGVVCGANP